MDISKSYNNSNGAKCVYYLLILNSFQELMWTLGETTLKRSEVPNLNFDIVIYYYINDFENVILLINAFAH